MASLSELERHFVENTQDKLWMISPEAGLSWGNAAALAWLASEQLSEVHFRQSLASVWDAETKLQSLELPHNGAMVKVTAQPCIFGFLLWLQSEGPHPKSFDAEMLSLILQCKDPRSIVDEVFPLMATAIGLDGYHYRFSSSDGFMPVEHETSSGLSQEEWLRISDSPAFAEIIERFKTTEFPQCVALALDKELQIFDQGANLWLYPIKHHEHFHGTLLIFRRSSTPFTLAQQESLDHWIHHLILAIDQLEEIRRLKYSERLFSIIGDTLISGSWISPASHFGVSTYVSQGFLNLLGVTNKTSDQVNWRDLIHPEDLVKLSESWMQACRDGVDFWEFESRMKNVEGKWIYVLSKGAAVRDLKDVLTHYVGINLDVTPYREAQIKLEKQTRTLAVLNEMAKKLAGLIEVDEILQVVIDAIQEVCDSEFATIFYRKFNPKDHDQVFFVHSGYSISQFGEFIPPEYNQLFNDRFKRQGIYLRGEPNANLGDETGGLHDEIQTISKDLHSYLAAPLESSIGELLGGLFMGHSDSDRFGPECVALVESIIDQASVVLDKAMLYQERQKTAEQLSLAVSIANIGEVYWDAESDIMELSPRAKEIFGITDEGVYTRDYLRGRITPVDRERADLSLEGAIRNRVDYEVEYRIVRQNGSKLWLATKGRGVYNEDGRLLGMAGVIQDITPQKQVESALRDARQRLEATLHAAEIGTWSWEVSSDQFNLDQNARRMFSKARHLLPGEAVKRLEDVVHPQDRDRVLSVIQRVLDGDLNEFETDFRIETDRGETRWFTGRGKLTRDASGEPKFLPGVLMDITERRRAEFALKEAKDAAEAANLAKDRFLAVLSHELRTPLTPVLMTVEDLEQDPNLDVEVRSALALVRRNVELEARLIDDLLDLSLIVSGKLNLYFEQVNFRELLHQVVEICRPQLEQKEMSVDLDVPEGDFMVEADLSRLNQILWNLLKNAVKFSPPKTEIRVVLQRLDDDMMMLRVIDQGIGIEAVALSRIFAAFEQEDHGQSHRFGGLGLGLAITKALVRLHQGQITAHSEGKGKGAMFELILPFRQGAQSEVHEPKVLADRSGLKYKILLVEDHVDTGTILSKLLRRSGHHVTLARNVVEALRLAESDQFDLMVSDIGLPDSSGYELMQEIDKRHQIPGIAISGYGLKEDLSKSRKAGFKAHLVKPILIQDLEQAIHELMHAKA